MSIKGKRIEIYWKMNRATSMEDGPVSSAPEWLSAAEREQYKGLRFPKRRSEWLAGRRVAKELLLAVEPGIFGRNRADVTIANEENGGPYAQIDGLRLSGSLSLSHRAGLAVAAWTDAAGVEIGIDLEWIEPRSEVFVRDYFTAGEADWVFSQVGRDQDHLVTLVWSAKEAGLKALRQGLRLDTRMVEIMRVASLSKGDDWEELPAGLHVALDSPLRVWHRRLDQSVLTLALLAAEGSAVTITQV